MNTTCEFCSTPRECMAEVVKCHMVGKPPGFEATDRDALTVATFLAILSDQRTDAEIIYMLQPGKVRSALKAIRESKI